MTPERKKKLRLLLRRKAAEELKRQQEAKANERRKVIVQRTGQKKALDSLSDGKHLAQVRFNRDLPIRIQLTSHSNPPF